MLYKIKYIKPGKKIIINKKPRWGNKGTAWRIEYKPIFKQQQPSIVDDYYIGETNIFVEKKK